MGGGLTTSSGATEMLIVANKPGLTESGGGHNTKGVDFQRWWAILRMVEMEAEGHSDYLLLFEAVQDVTELDSSTTPTKARIYQVKKKDRGEWSWSTLTGTTEPKTPKKPKAKGTAAKAKPATPLLLEKIASSALGKLHISLAEFSALDAEAFFVSNAGCDIPLLSGTNAATAMPCSAAEFAAEHLALLSKALQSISGTGKPIPDLKKLSVKRVAVHPDAPEDYVVKAAFDLLGKRSAPHASQAGAFVDALFIKVAPLGRRTATCSTYEQLVAQRGFSRADFLSALGELQNVPDVAGNLEHWLLQLQVEGLGFMEVTRLRTRAANILREQLTGTLPNIAKDVDAACDSWVATNKCGSSPKQYLEAGAAAMKGLFSTQPEEELMARLLIRALKRCVDPN